MLTSNIAYASGDILLSSPRSLLYRGSEGNEHSLSVINGLGAELNTLLVPQAESVLAEITPEGVSSSFDVLTYSYSADMAGGAMVLNREVALPRIILENIGSFTAMAQQVFETVAFATSFLIGELHAAPFPFKKSSSEESLSPEKVNVYPEDQIGGEESIVKDTFNGDGYIEK